MESSVSNNLSLQQHTSPFDNNDHVHNHSLTASIMYSYASRALLRASIAPMARLHTTRLVAVAQPKGQAPASSRQPKERTLLDQNPHLSHAVSSQPPGVGREKGHGNADPEKPKLPSKQLEAEEKARKDQKPGSRSGGGKKTGGKRGLHTSAPIYAREKGDGHSADSYFKDVDTSPSTSGKTHHVGGSTETPHRPNEQYAEPDKEYATVSKDEPYEPPAEHSNGEKQELKDQKLRYGGANRDAERDAPSPEEGPHKKDAGGRKPEGRN